MSSSNSLRLQSVTVFVRDQDRSLRFFVDQLGFKLIADTVLPDGTRWVAVAPSEDQPILALLAPTSGSELYERIGRQTEVIFIAEDVPAKLTEWRKNGVQFREMPVFAGWNLTFAAFEDPDGNSFSLVGYDAATQRIESARRAEAAKREAELRAAQELDIAKQVQARLFPQSKPQIASLDYAGICVQARQVGGDYYDFLALGPDRLGLVLGDIAGKGIGGALLMANLQANLRSQCANSPDDPITRLPSVNQLFFDTTGDSSYATLFFGEYLAQSHRLRFANCGHLPGLLLQRDSTVLRLEPTATVLGLFKKWDCARHEVPFLPGDLLVIYTDGLSEATNEGGEEFGEDRLVNAIRHHKELGAESLAQTLLSEVRLFAPNEQQDDITLIIAKVRPA